MANLRYYDAGALKLREAKEGHISHSEFLRTGRIRRHKSNWNSDERRYMTYEEVTERTIRNLTSAGETTHDRINSFHESIKFPKLVVPRTLVTFPHLGYCHITAAKTSFAEFENIPWAFFIANFTADIGENNRFIDRPDIHYARMYFAVAMQRDKETRKMEIDHSIRGNGVLFLTHDPKTAFKNLMMLGTRSARFREFIKTL